MISLKKPSKYSDKIVVLNSVLAFTIETGMWDFNFIDT
jgi:hypothetical protein